MKKPVSPPELNPILQAVTAERLPLVFQCSEPTDQQSHGISYDVARKDLLFMADTLGLFDNTKRGRQYYFVAPTDLEQCLYE